MEKFKVHDAIENKDLKFYGEGAVCAISIYALDDNNQPTGNAIDFADLTPGRYVAIATAADGSTYDGQTPQSNVLELFQGYEVTIPAGEYITYYKDENIYVEDEDAQLYTITSVGNETATATTLSVAKAYTPLLVKNKASETKTILLIPTEDDADNVEAAPQFIGTLEATTIAASDASTNNYALNGKQFVWVRDAVDIAANKAWLSISSGPAARNIVIVFDDATGIDSMVNGQWSMDTWYDLSGRKVANGQSSMVNGQLKKGVYILNGKKVVIR